MLFQALWTGGNVTSHTDIAKGSLGLREDCFHVFRSFMSMQLRNAAWKTLSSVRFVDIGRYCADFSLILAKNVQSILSVVKVVIIILLWIHHRACFTSRGVRKQFDVQKQFHFHQILHQPIVSRFTDFGLTAELSQMPSTNLWIFSYENSGPEVLD